jgi:hypothetical protein
MAHGDPDDAVHAFMAGVEHLRFVTEEEHTTFMSLHFDPGASKQVIQHAAEVARLDLEIESQKSDLLVLLSKALRNTLGVYAVRITETYEEKRDEIHEAARRCVRDDWNQLLNVFRPSKNTEGSYFLKLLAKYMIDKFAFDAGRRESRGSSAAVNDVSTFAHDLPSRVQGGTMFRAVPRSHIVPRGAGLRPELTGTGIGVSTIALERERRRRRMERTKTKSNMSSFARPKASRADAAQSRVFGSGFDAEDEHEEDEHEEEDEEDEREEDEEEDDDVDLLESRGLDEDSDMEELGRYAQTTTTSFSTHSRTASGVGGNKARWVIVDEDDE